MTNGVSFESVVVAEPCYSHVLAIAIGKSSPFRAPKGKNKARYNH